MRKKTCKSNISLSLTHILRTWRIWWASNNSSRWQMGFNWVSKGLRSYSTYITHLLPNDPLRGRAVSSLNLPNNPYKGRQQCVEVWRYFVHSYPIYCRGLLCCRTLWRSGFLRGTRMDSLRQSFFFMSAHSNCAFAPADYDGSRHSPFLFIVRTGIHCGLNKQAYATSANCWPERFSVT
jgi:hypothetical protein